MPPRTRIDVDQAARLYQQEGWTLRRIAAHLGCSFQRLSTLLRDRGVEMRTVRHRRAPRLPEVKRAAIRAMIGSGANAAQIARQVAVCRTSVIELADREELTICKGRRPSWDVEAARKLRGQGLSYQRVAAAVGGSPATVWRVLNREQADAS
jgi:transcriptional regulator with XRE-family HTH domain